MNSVQIFHFPKMCFIYSASWMKIKLCSKNTGRGFDTIFFVFDKFPKLF